MIQSVVKVEIGTRNCVYILRFWGAVLLAFVARTIRTYCTKIITIYGSREIDEDFTRHDKK